MLLGGCRPCEDVSAGLLLCLAPLCRSDSHVALEGALEGRFRLIAYRLSHRAGGKRRSLQFVRCKRHPDVGQEITRRSSELLLEWACEGCPRHVAQARKGGQRPRARRLVEQSGHRWRKARMTGQSKETAWRAFGLAGQPQYKREHRGRQRVQHRPSAEMIVRGLAPHQRDEASELRGRLLLSSLSAGMH